MGSEMPFWERIEGSRSSDVEDSQHWVHVYQELLNTLRSMRDSSDGDGELIEKLIAAMESRLAYWTAHLHDAPVAEARAARRGAARRRHTA